MATVQSAETANRAARLRQRRGRALASGAAIRVAATRPVASRPLCHRISAVRGGSHSMSRALRAAAHSDASPGLRRSSRAVQAKHSEAQAPEEENGGWKIEQARGPIARQRQPPHRAPRPRGARPHGRVRAPARPPRPPRRPAEPPIGLRRCSRLPSKRNGKTMRSVVSRVSRAPAKDSAARARRPRSCAATPARAQRYPRGSAVPWSRARPSPHHPPYPRAIHGDAPRRSRRRWRISVPSTMATRFDEDERPSHQLGPAQREHVSHDRIENRVDADPVPAPGRLEGVGREVEVDGPVGLLAEAGIVTFPLGADRREEARVPCMRGQQRDHDGAIEHGHDHGRAAGESDPARARAASSSTEARSQGGLMPCRE